MAERKPIRNKPELVDEFLAEALQHGTPIDEATAEAEADAEIAAEIAANAAADAEELANAPAAPEVTPEVTPEPDYIPASTLAEMATGRAKVEEMEALIATAKAASGPEEA